jgi:hypothetical protein
MRRSLQLGLVAAVLLAFGVVTVPLYLAHQDDQDRKAVAAAERSIVLPGTARSCTGLDASVDRCSHTTGAARPVVDSAARQLKKLGFHDIKTQCGRAMSKLPEACSVIALRGDHSVQIFAHGHLLPDPPLRFSGLDVGLGSD